jgi:hypothetical protein
MAIAVALLLPYVLITKKFQLPQKKYLILAILLDLFVSDVGLEHSHSGIECCYASLTD